MEDEDVNAVFESIKNIYRFDFDLKKEQINIIQLILNERHVFGLLPTGFGKSVCYILTIYKYIYKYIYINKYIARGC